MTRSRIGEVDVEESTVAACEEETVSELVETQAVTDWEQAAGTCTACVVVVHVLATLEVLVDDPVFVAARGMMI